MTSAGGRRRRSSLASVGVFLTGALFGALLQRLQLSTTQLAAVSEAVGAAETTAALTTKVAWLEKQASFLRSRLVPFLSPADMLAIAGSGVTVELPYCDLLLAVFTGDDDDAESKQQALRQLYGRYKGWVDAGRSQERKKLEFKVVYIVGAVNAPPEGVLKDDVFTVNAQPGYRNIVAKTKGMMALTKHFNFRFLMKSDDDTVVCVKQLLRHLHSLPTRAQSRVYAGVPTYCGLQGHAKVGRVIMDPAHKWYDKKYAEHTMGSMQCYPPYHQGAGYVLGAALVRFLYTGRDRLLTFVNEDVTVGTWLMGVDRVMVSLKELHRARLWECPCASAQFGSDHKWRERNGAAFYHNCKRPTQMAKCQHALGLC